MLASIVITYINPFVSAMKSVLRGLLPFQKWLRQQSPDSSSSLIKSIEGAPVVLLTNRNDCRVTQWVHQQLLAKGCGIIPATLTSAFPTPTDIHRQSDLLKRTGAETVVAVGGGQCMDLAQCSNSSFSSILVPTGYGGILAASTSHALILDTQEEAIVVHQKKQKQIDTILVLLEEEHLWTENANQAKIIAKKLIRGGNNVGKNGTDDTSESRNLVDLVHAAGQVVSYGTDNEPRTIEWALLMSLLPTIAPERDALSFLANPSSSQSNAMRIERMVELIQQNSSLCRIQDASTKLLEQSLLENKNLH